jgi:hypothetical protein
MKTKYLFIFILVALIAGFNSCEESAMESDPEGTLSIGIAVDQEIPAMKSAISDSLVTNLFIAVISVINEAGEMVLQDEKIELYRFNDQFVSEEIQLKTGRYDLVRFLVIDPNGNVLFAAPMEESPLAYLVFDPLPVHFRIAKGEHTMVTPEVLPAWNHSPEDFGYLSFGISVVRPLVFFAAAYMYYENPMIMAPSLITSAEMLVVADSAWRHAFKLEPKINRIIIRDGFPYYFIRVKKEGFEPFEGRFHRDELKRHTELNPLMFPLKYEFSDSTIITPPDSTIIIPGDTVSSWN